MKERERVPICQKQNLTIEEAAEYSNIGINRIRALVSEPNCPFVLSIGTKRLIKREKFDVFVASIDVI